MARGQQRFRDGRPPWHRGCMTDDETADFVGGVSGPLRGGMRGHASWPLASLSIRQGELRLRGRGPLRRVFRETVADPVDVIAEAVRGPLMGGVVIRVNGEKWLFWTPERTQVLSALGHHGASVTAGERRMRGATEWGDARPACLLPPGWSCGVGQP
jgi:hypothetical protein